MPTYILAIESSCDDTSVAILKDNEVLINIVCNQEVHQQYGGVVPELASRDHLKNIIPAIDVALKNARISLTNIHVIAVTRGPGLIGSLLVGISAAKSLALCLNIPLIEVNHLQAHILAHFIKDSHTNKTLQFPFLGLIVSGGHTQLLRINNFFDYELLGETLDDAAGEALDKAAKMLGLGFPGGPIIDQLAQKGNPNTFEFPKAQVKHKHFSFSGIKTALLYLIQKEESKNPNFVSEQINNLCASYQSTVVEMLIEGLKQAIEYTGLKQIAIAGGVSANSHLRAELKKLAEKTQTDIFTLPMKYCTDNAAMIGIVGYYKYQQQLFSDLNITPIPRWEGFSLPSSQI